jgi:hypothetical protein
LVLFILIDCFNEISSMESSLQRRFCLTGRANAAFSRALYNC